MEFDADERKAILTLGLAAGIVVAYDRLVSVTAQGIVSINFTNGLVPLLLAILGMIISVYIHEAGHKWFAGKIGYETHTEPYTPGQLVGVLIAIFTFGWIIFFTPNTSDLESIPEKRIHKHRKYENPRQQAFIAASGILVTAVWATLLHGAFLVTGSGLIRDIMYGNLWLMIYSLIPFELLGLYLLRLQTKIEQLPQSDGLYLLHYTPVAWVFAAAFVLVVSLGVTIASNAATTGVHLQIAYVLFSALAVAMVAAMTVWVRFFVEDL